MCVCGFWCLLRTFPDFRVAVLNSYQSTTSCECFRADKYKPNSCVRFQLQHLGSRSFPSWITLSHKLTHTHIHTSKTDAFQNFWFDYGPATERALLFNVVTLRTLLISQYTFLGLYAHSLAYIRTHKKKNGFKWTCLDYNVSFLLVVRNYKFAAINW